MRDFYLSSHFLPRGRHTARFLEMFSFLVLGYVLTAALFYRGAVGAAIDARDTTPQVVFAHVIVGNTYPYTVEDWEDDINLAHAYGIDAFALDVGSDDWEPDRINDAYVYAYCLIDSSSCRSSHISCYIYSTSYTAAQNTGTGFKIFMSFDM